MKRGVTEAKWSDLRKKAEPPCSFMKSRKKRRINSECCSLEDWTDLSRRTASSRDMGKQTLCSLSHGRSPIMRLLNCTFVFILFRIRTWPPLFVACTSQSDFSITQSRGKKITDEIKKRDYAFLTIAINRE